MNLPQKDNEKHKDCCEWHPSNDISRERVAGLLKWKYVDDGTMIVWKNENGEDEWSGSVPLPDFFTDPIWREPLLERLREMCEHKDKYRLETILNLFNIVFLKFFPNKVINKVFIFALDALDKDPQSNTTS